MLFDPGLQPERTELAWRRTALVLAIGSLLGIRLLPLSLNSPWWVAPGVLGLVAAASIWLAARIRYHAYNAALRSVDSANPALPGAVLLAALTLGTTIVGLFAGSVILMVQ